MNGLQSSSNPLNISTDNPKLNQKQNSEYSSRSKHEDAPIKLNTLLEEVNAAVAAS